jgi:hypothetical protein
MMVAMDVDDDDDVLHTQEKPKCYGKTCSSAAVPVTNPI